jgi:hypothetical protein
MQDEPDLAARTIAGVMLGFPATVLGNLVTVLVKWVGTLKLWDLQQDMPVLSPPTHDQPATRLLRDAFLATMREAPVPYVVWRTDLGDMKDGPPDTAEAMDAYLEAHRVVVGLGSAMDDGGDSMLMFGGARQDGELKTVHACPGYAMAMGVMVGCVAALLTAGTLGRTPDPRVLRLAGSKHV